MAGGRPTSATHCANFGGGAGLIFAHTELHHAAPHWSETTSHLLAPNDTRKDAFKESNTPPPACPLPKGEYRVRKAKLNAESWPTYMSRGLTKIRYTFEKDQEDVFGNSKFDVQLEKIGSIKGDEETLFEFNLKIVGRERSLAGTFKTVAVFDESVFGNSKFEIRLEKWEAIKGDEETLIEFNLKIVGRERSLNGTLKTLTVIDKSLMAHGRLQAFKNGDWVQSNLKVDMNGCDFFQLFVKRFYKDFVKHFPDPICPLPVC
ncbi:uncharacterized protein Dana_GF27310 [Drosophila ananassae]|uniref:Uncharacterized protein n=1 Tax=Drosophila ananassae TaxID=7217 RepID=A0A0P8XF14_DROAN|nr:uncharacterized protein Dana_GF27310 [Drosophila ananassae]